MGTGESQLISSDQRPIPLEETAACVIFHCGVNFRSSKWLPFPLLGRRGRLRTRAANPQRPGETERQSAASPGSPREKGADLLCREKALLAPGRGTGPGLIPGEAATKQSHDQERSQHHLPYLLPYLLKSLENPEEFRHITLMTFLAETLEQSLVLALCHGQVRVSCLELECVQEMQVLQR
ncbi:uncharacterized protein LOC143824828 [Paroedura picta]|uniref:uncharacterized protein LOC143824828 n=1 Tax=Paroedura picta TaxID=143630 RepID=UPI004056B07E